MSARTADRGHTPTWQEVLRGMVLCLGLGPAAGLLLAVVWVAAVVFAVVTAWRALQDLVWQLGIVCLAGGILALAVAVAGALAG